MTHPAFSFDASACSGCKACQAACKDKNQLPVGVLWRRVYEVTGGGWARAGETWTSDVFAYNLSLSCHHCAQPICAEVCPTQAMHKRADGIVVVDHDRCMGCQYCAWACPYEAPQYDPRRGQMTKCDFCADNLAAGQPPACVAACPMRVLDVHDSWEASPHPLPLPDTALTQPALVVTPHQASARAGALGNAEEVRRPLASEPSLVAFTILAQLSVGTTWTLSLLKQLNRGALVGIVVVAFVSLLASFLHLGQPRHAWRALSNLRTSWLSREVLSASLFVLSLIGALLTDGAGIWAANITGFALLISMVQVYRLRTVREWNGRTTIVSFFATTLLLGSVVSGTVLAAGPVVALAAAGLLVLRQFIGRRDPRPVVLWRTAALAALLVTPRAPAAWWAAFAAVLLAEGLARRQFYAGREPLSAWRFAAPPNSPAVSR
jgi:anaerobic dimethyl sulfoxide reductase subunit B (iron-sulfur subunit)